MTTSGAAADGLEALMDLPVLARGSAGPKPATPPLEVEPAPCPVMQMRSDWVNTPRGIRARRTSPTGAEHFHLTSVRRLDELKAVLAEDRVTASFENPLPFALTGVRLRMHYEGCYGKPGATELASQVQRLGPGERLEHVFPLLEKADPKRVHRAAVLVLEIAGSEGPADAKVWTDLDVSLHELGIDFECERK